MTNNLKPVPGKRNRIVGGHDVPFSLITQFKLESLFGLRRELQELEEEIALALSHGAKVEEGIHSAELIPVRNDGKLHLELVLR